MTEHKNKNDAAKRLFRHAQQPMHSKLSKWTAPFTIIVLVFLIDLLSQAHGNGIPPVNQAPVAVDTIASVTLGTESVIVDVSDKFSDADGDTLIYKVESSEDAIATAHVDGSKVTISPRSVFSATITVTAADWCGRSARQRIAVKVDQTPVAVGRTDLVTLGTDPVTVDVLDKFSDADGDKLTYTAVSNADSIAMARINGSKVTITPVSKGYAIITVTATDPWGLHATQDIAIVHVNSTNPIIKYTIKVFAGIGFFGVFLPFFFEINIFDLNIGPKYKMRRTKMDKKRS